MLIEPLRFREPVFLSIRELVMSYFEGYFNPWGKRRFGSIRCSSTWNASTAQAG